uniref:Uncharacterized protein n=1 Tax=Macaca mulatta TaxID=9544 RepID=A0A5F7ZYL1_MACMU
QRIQTPLKEFLRPAQILSRLLKLLWLDYLGNRYMLNNTWLGTVTHHRMLSGIYKSFLKALKSD